MNEDKIKKDLEEIETINIELDHRVSNLITENEHLKQTYKQLYDSIKPARTRSKEQCDDLINQVNLKSVEISNLNASLQEKVLVITALKNDLRKLKGKALVDNVVTKHPSDPKMLKIDVESITPKLLNKKTAHSAYIKHTQEDATVLRDLVEHELLTNISKTCVSINNADEKLMAVTPKNKDKRVRFTEPVTSSGNTNIKTSSSSNLVSNKPMLSSTGVKPTTSASGSQPSSNTKKDKIQQTPSSTQKNKVEAHPRKVKSSLKNKDCVVEPKGIAHVQHSKLNANSKLKCVKCNGCMLYDNHDLCVLDFINNVNARTKSKSVKKNSKRKVWKPTGKVFTNIGYIWRPTGRTFTIVGNPCPLTRITTTTEVPLRKPTARDNETSKPIVTLVYSRKPRKSKTNVPVSKSKVLKSVFANKKEPSQSWGSIVSDVPSSSLDDNQNDHVAKILGYGDYQIGNVMISRVYYIEGLKHNLFSVGQFCNSNLEVAFRQHTCFIRNLEGVDLLTGSRRGNNLYSLFFSKKKPHKPKSEDTNQEKLYLLHIDLCGPLASTMLIYAKASLFLWAKAVATACYTQNRSIIRLHHGKTPYELLHDKLPNLSFFHVFGALCYPTNDSENLDFDELTAMASEHSSLGLPLHENTPAIISSGLMLNPPPSTPFVPPSITNWDILSQPLFDELITPPPSVDHPAPEVIAPINEVVASKPTASTVFHIHHQPVDQMHITSDTLIQHPQTQISIIPNDVEEDNHDLDVAHLNNDPFFGISILENDSEPSSSSDVIPTVVHTATPKSEHVTKWIKDHPLDNIIGELDRT
ncbi:hypothetical protein Tco_0747350 [Tanacetum coccineum]|uniref:Integrase, catalytic region, zinc finger, CCHC-type, peptidase aspartic, catalytic n=1 Tax=Tanacetum coccineum TaxID=301880 RepID=A0ABQ4YSG4_9ASTR